MSQQAIDHYEKGRARPVPETLMKMASVFNTTIDYLMGFTDNPKRTLSEDQIPDYIKTLHAFHADPNISDEVKHDVEKKLSSYIRFVLDNPDQPHR